MFDLLKPLLDRRADDAPWVIAQLGQSLDGFIATHGGDANYVNGEQVLLHLHRLRALCDAVVVGADTVAIDNPQLTTRRVAGDNPVRVVLDPKLRLDPASKVFSDAQAPTLLVCDAAQADAAAARFGAARCWRCRPWSRATARCTCARCSTRWRSAGCRCCSSKAAA